jgi:hypothetical protein
VRANGTFSLTPTISDIIVGEISLSGNPNALDFTTQRAVLSWDLSGIQPSWTILSGAFSALVSCQGEYETLGMTMEHVLYGTTVDAGDYSLAVSPPLPSTISVPAFAELSLDVTEWVKADYISNLKHLQVRLRRAGAEVFLDNFFWDYCSFVTGPTIKVRYQP